ncbi:unnamed protein product, partial [marine sediment metagenome]
MTLASIKKRLRGRRIAVLAGGSSCEREVSLRSGWNVCRAIRKIGIEPVSIDPARDLIGALKRHRIDLVFPALHGRSGEDGIIQGVLDYLGIAYAGSGVLASALGMDKVASKKIFAYEGIPTPAWQEIHDPRRDFRK